MFQHFENAINKVIEGLPASRIIIRKSENQIPADWRTAAPTAAAGWKDPGSHCWALIFTNRLPGLWPAGKGSYHVTLPAEEYRNRWYWSGIHPVQRISWSVALDRINELSINPGEICRQQNFPLRFLSVFGWHYAVHGTKPPEASLLLFILLTLAACCLSQPTAIPNRCYKTNA